MSGEDTQLFTVKIGPSGGDRGYTGITSKLNSLLPSVKLSAATAAVTDQFLLGYIPNGMTHDQMTTVN